MRFSEWLICQHCGLTFPVRNGVYTQTYCSKACKDAAWSARASERFLERFDRSGGPDACHPWTGGTDADGYGIGTVFGKQVRVHRAAWEMANGKAIPATVIGGDGNVGRTLICHRCDNRACGNPAHLFLGTAWDNNHDRSAKGRPRNLPAGDAHWSHRNPEKVRRGPAHHYYGKGLPH